MQIATKYPDIFFTPEYQELFKDTAFGGEPCHFNAAGIDYRFYKRPIEGTPYFDIVSPYGYSGPVEIEETGVDDWVEFYDTFEQWCHQHYVIAEFARVHPFIGNWIETDYLHFEHPVFYIDLTKSESEIWKGFDKGCRSAIKKEPNLQASYTFRPLYEKRMGALKASPAYLFTERFWQILPAISFEYGMFGASCILLRYGDYCHYFLAASEAKGNPSALLWEAIKWAKSQGCKIFNLGGGLKAGDSLESFKRSFSHASKPFYTYRRVHNQAVYDELSKGIVTDYFPAYRAERTKQ